MKTAYILGSTHKLASIFGKVESPERISISGPLFYGTSDPVANTSELVLTGMTAVICGQPAKFSVYRGGRTEYAKVSRDFSNRFIAEYSIALLSIEDALRVINAWLGLEVEMTTYEDLMVATGIWDIKLSEMASTIRNINPKTSRLCYVPNGKEISTIYTDARWLKRNSNITVKDLHEMGGWLGGTPIHYSLRRFSEKFVEHLNLVPWGDKGNVYRIYRNSGIRFILGPSLNIRPIGIDPKWVPLEISIFGSILNSWSEEQKLNLFNSLKVLIIEGMKGEIRRIDLQFCSVNEFQIKTE